MHADTLTALVRERLGLENFELHTREAWASVRAGSREDIRRFIFDNIEANDAALDLSVTPRLIKHSLSISHNREVGGFAVAAASDSIGFDVETNARVREDLVARVSNASEMAAAPSVAALWVAKEAAYKSLVGSRQPGGLADIEIGDWQFETRGTFSCRAVRIKGRETAGSRGIVTVGRTTSACVFTSPKTKKEASVCVGS